MAETPILPASFFSPSVSLPPPTQLRWYMCVVVTLSSLNYPDVIPQVYAHLDSELLSTLSPEDRFSAVRKLREGLIKSTGIAGAARTGNAMRTLARCIPEELQEKTSPRSQESDTVARERGKAFWSRIYARNKAFDPGASVRASPDYAFVVREVLYARIFSFDAVIDDLLTGYIIVSALYGMDCPNQLQNHMKGMLINGATKEDLEELRDLCLGLAKILGVRSRHPPPLIPEKPEGETSG
ncbi:hypothetical protein ASPVEDRAFT_88904 [Aspergillus versicolor CBS 583.65]|uniref:Carboxymuconolactone decarboxylase-like domain-containing protein n=1 Tax=Aspergillus versicolor CBS 583.65 TaxID=1036611 RepID=A0A1L9Q1S9_ASPVE|nr:uncharacterized protein ASPVEDRAFT_88904 [Aspergillus versicolor CBS 583.65]OJJ07666.1 hypothetical protein ASPVEDRAFT_88904 [Aspergillus versicolor CBS 583.65]